MLHLHPLQFPKESVFGCDLIPVSAKKDKLRNSGAPEPLTSTSERRRIGRIVRDDRDTASVEWVDAPADYARVPLSIESTLPPGVKRAAGGGYNPYETGAPGRGGGAVDKRPAQRDLRKLSEWIKQMRELEERKKRGDE